MEGAVAPAGGVRPVGVGGILDTAFRLYRVQAINLWKIVALIVIPVQVIDKLVFVASLPSGVFAHDGTLYVVGSSTSIGAAAVIVAIVLGVISAALATGALLRCLIDTYAERPTDWRVSISFAADRLGPLLWLSILAGILIIIGFVLFVIPGIYLLVSWCVAIPVLLFEGITGFGALQRSRQLVSGRWWATFAALLLGIVLIVLVEFVIGVIVGAIESGLHVNSIGLAEVIYGIGGVVAYTLTYPLFAAITTVLYVDLRVRKENVDVHQLAGVGAGPAATSY